MFVNMRLSGKQVPKDDAVNVWGVPRICSSRLVSYLDPGSLNIFFITLYQINIDK